MGGPARSERDREREIQRLRARWRKSCRTTFQNCLANENMLGRACTRAKTCFSQRARHAIERVSWVVVCSAQTRLCCNIPMRFFCMLVVAAMHIIYVYVHVHVHMDWLRQFEHANRTSFRGCSARAHVAEHTHTHHTKTHVQQPRNRRMSRQHAHKSRRRRRRRRRLHKIMLVDEQRSSGHTTLGRIYMNEYVCFAHR